MGRILLNGDHDSKGKIMLTALDSSNAVLTQFLMVDEWDCSPHRLHSAVTRESSDLALIPFTLLAWTHLLSSHRSNLDHSKALTQSFDSLSALLVHFTFHSSSRLVLWKSVSTPWRSELTPVDHSTDLCWLLQGSLLTTHSFLPPFSCTWSLSSFSAVFSSSLPG